VKPVKKRRLSGVRASHPSAMLAAVLVTGLAGSTYARADTPVKVQAERAAALATLLRSAAKAARAKRFEACIEAYEKAYRIEPSPLTLGELGVCEEPLGRNVAAFQHLSAALRTPGIERAAEPWKRFGERLLLASARVAQVFLSTDPTSARLVVDGRPLGQVEGRTVTVEAGAHVFAARLDGYEDAVQSRTVEAGDLSSIHLKLARKGPAVPPAPPAPSAPPAPAAALNGVVPASNAHTPARPAPASSAAPAWYAPSWSPRGVFVGLTYAAAATALASGGTAIGLEVDRQSIAVSLAQQGSANACADPASQAAGCAGLVERRDQRSAARTVFIGSAVGTGAAAATALVLSLVQKKARPVVAAVAVVPSVSRDGGGMVLVGVW
jgi:hypothetical protein